MVRTMVATPALRQSQEGALGHSGEQVGHAVGAAALPVGSSKHHRDGVPALVSIGGNQFNPTGAHVHAQDLTLPVGIDSRRHHHHADVDDAAAHVAHFIAALDIKVFFADEAHFRADAELRGKWVLKGEPALVDSTSPRRGEKAGYYSAVCLETGEVEWMELEGNSNAVTSAAFLLQLREALQAAAGDLGQCPGAPRRGGAGLFGDARLEAEVGEPAGVQPGLQRR